MLEMFQSVDRAKAAGCAAVLGCTVLAGTCAVTSLCPAEPRSPKRNRKYRLKHKQHAERTREPHATRARKRNKPAATARTRTNGKLRRPQCSDSAGAAQVAKLVDCETVAHEFGWLDYGLAANNLGQYAREFRTLGIDQDNCMELFFGQNSRENWDNLLSKVKPKDRKKLKAKIQDIIDCSVVRNLSPHSMTSRLQDVLLFAPFPCCADCIKTASGHGLSNRGRGEATIR